MNRRSERLLLGSLVSSIGLQYLGATAIMPMLPLFLVHSQVPVAMVGIIMGSYFLGSVLAQYPAGWAADRWGQRPVIVAGLLLYAAASATFVLAGTGPMYAVLRCLQGFGSGAVRVGGLSMVGRYVAPERRGTGFAWLYAGELAGLALGPIVGSLVPEQHFRMIFVGAAVCSVLACLPMLFLRTVDHGTTESGDAVSVRRLMANRSLRGAMLVGLAGGLSAGVYEACWSLLLESKGASTFQIGLSWAAYAVPFIIMAPLTGRLVDRYDQRILAIAALLMSALYLTTYPFVGSPKALILLGAMEAVGFTVAYPAALSLLSRSVPPAMVGRAQSLFGVSELSAIAVGSAVAGSLFARHAWLPFVATSGVVLVILAGAAWAWHSVPGRPANGTDSGTDFELNPLILEH